MHPLQEITFNSRLKNVYLLCLQWTLCCETPVRRMRRRKRLYLLIVRSWPWCLSHGREASTNHVTLLLIHYMWPIHVCYRCSSYGTLHSGEHVPPDTQDGLTCMFEELCEIVIFSSMKFLLQQFWLTASCAWWTLRSSTTELTPWNCLSSRTSVWDTLRLPRKSSSKSENLAFKYNI